MSEINCHPWTYGSLMWMHNGNITHFDRIKRPLQNMLSDRFFHVAQGSTDSEWAFSLYLEILSRDIDPTEKHIPHDLLRQAMFETIATLNTLAHQTLGDDAHHPPSLINFAVTDGASVVATRYVTSRKDEAASLYFATGTTFAHAPDGGDFRMVRVNHPTHGR